MVLDRHADTINYPNDYARLGLLPTIYLMIDSPASKILNDVTKTLLRFAVTSLLQKLEHEQLRKMYKHRLGGTRLTSDLCTLHNTSFLQTVTVPQIKNYEIADPNSPIYTNLYQITYVPCKRNVG
jgi:hypothetical protein